MSAMVLRVTRSTVRGERVGVILEYSSHLVGFDCHRDGICLEDEMRFRLEEESLGKKGGKELVLSVDVQKVLTFRE